MTILMSIIYLPYVYFDVNYLFTQCLFDVEFSIYSTSILTYKTKCYKSVPSKVIGFSLSVQPSTCIIVLRYLLQQQL